MGTLLDQLKALQKSKFLRADRATAQIAQLRGEKLVDIFLEAGDNTELRKELFQTVSEVRAELENNITRQDQDIKDNKDELTNLITEKDAAVWAEFERRLKEGLIDKERFASSVTAGSQLMSQSLTDSLEKLCTCQTEHSDALIAKLAELIQTIIDKPMGGGGGGAITPPAENYFSVPVILGTRALKAGQAGKWTISSNATGSISISGFDVTISNEEGGEILAKRLSATNDANRATATLDWLVPADIEKSEIYTIKAIATGGNIVSKEGSFQVSVALAGEDNPDIPTPPPEVPVEVITKPSVTGTTEMTEGEKGTWTVSAFTQVKEAIVNYFTVKIYNDQNALLSTQTVIPAEKPEPTPPTPDNPGGPETPPVEGSGGEEEGAPGAREGEFTPVEVTGTFEFTVPVGIARTGTYKITATATDTGLAYTSEIGEFSFTVNKKIDIQYLGTPTVTGELDGRPGQTLTLTAHAETLTEDAEVTLFNITFNDATSTAAATNGSAEFQVAIPADAKPETSIRLIVTAVDQKNSYTSQALLIYVNVVKELGTNAWTTEEPEDLEFLPGYTEKVYSCGGATPTGGLGPDTCPGSDLQFLAGVTSASGCAFAGKFYWQITGFNMQEKAVNITVAPATRENGHIDNYTLLLNEVFTIPETAVMGSKFKASLAFTWTEEGVNYKHTLVDNLVREVKTCQVINPDDEPPMPSDEQLAPGSDFAMPIIGGPTTVMAGQELQIPISSSAGKTITAFEIFLSTETIKRSLVAVANKTTLTFTIPSDWPLNRAFRLSAVAVAGSERSERATKVFIVKEMSYGDSTVIPAPTIDGPTEVVAAQTPSWSLTSTNAVSFDVKWANEPVKTLAAINGVAAFSKFIPSATAVNTTFKLQVVAIAEDGSRTAIVSKTAKVIEPKIIIPTIHVGAGDSAGALTITPSAFATVPAGHDTQAAVRYRILKSDSTVLYDSGEITDSSKFTSVTYDVGALVSNFPGTGSYIIQVAQKGANLGWTDYAETVKQLIGVNTPSITHPANNSSPIRAGLEITGTAFSPSASDTHQKSRWIIRQASNGAVVYDSGEIAATTKFTLTSAIVINSNIQLNTSYTFEIYYKGAKYGWSSASPKITVTKFSYDWAPGGYSRLFTSSGSWTVPSNVTSIGIVCIGGGQSSASGVAGGAGVPSNTTSGGNGGSGGASVAARYGGAVVGGIYQVTPGSTISFTVGSNAVTGGSSNIVNCVTCEGGREGSRGNYLNLNQNVKLNKYITDTAVSGLPTLDYIWPQWLNVALNTPVHSSSCTVTTPAKSGASSGNPPSGNNGGSGGVGANGQAAGGTTIAGTAGQTGGAGGSPAIGTIEAIAGVGDLRLGAGGAGGQGGKGGNSYSESNSSVSGGLGGLGGSGAYGGTSGSGGSGGLGGRSKVSNTSARRGPGGNGGTGGQGGGGGNILTYGARGGNGGAGGAGGKAIADLPYGGQGGQGGQGGGGGTRVTFGSCSGASGKGGQGGKGGTGLTTGGSGGQGGAGGHSGSSPSAGEGLIVIYY